MKEAIIAAGPQVIIQSGKVPSPPTDKHVIIRVHTTGTNPKDWKLPEWNNSKAPSQTGDDIASRTINSGTGSAPINQGDDIAGTIHAVGSAVTEFKPGDRVAAFHEMMAPGGSYAEYAVAHAHTTFHIPQKTSYEEAATIPLAAMTSALGLFQELKLPPPWVKKTEEQKTNTPVLIYGAASAVGAFAIKLLKASSIGPIIGVAGRGQSFVEGILDTSKGDVIVDYRDGDEKVVEGIKAALKGRKLLYAYDAVTNKGSVQNVYKVLDKEKGKFTVILPLPEGLSEPIPEAVCPRTMVGTVHIDKSPVGDREFGFVMYRFLARGLEEGWFSGHPYEVIPGGLNGLQKALKDLKDGKASGVKYVAHIADTEGLEDQ